MQDIKAIKRRLSDYAQLKKRLEYNENEIKAIDIALFKIRSDPDYGMLKMMFFEGKKQEEIAEKYFYDKTTIWRRIKKLLKKFAEILDGERD